MVYKIFILTIALFVCYGCIDTAKNIKNFTSVQTFEENEELDRSAKHASLEWKE